MLPLLLFHIEQQLYREVIFPLGPSPPHLKTTGGDFVPVSFVFHTCEKCHHFALNIAPFWRCVCNFCGGQTLFANEVQDPLVWAVGDLFYGQECFIVQQYFKWHTLRLLIQVFLFEDSDT